MPTLSTLRGPVTTGLRTACAQASKQSNNVQYALQVRNMAGPRKMEVTPSNFFFTKLKDDFHFYFLLTAIPLGIFITYMKVRIGPAKLVETPEGYVPEGHEYIKEPIGRLFKKYVYEDYRKVYERSLYFIYVSDQFRRERALTKKVKELNSNRGDIRGWYFVPENTTDNERTVYYQRQEDHV